MNCRHILGSAAHVVALHTRKPPCLLLSHSSLSPALRSWAWLMDLVVLLYSSNCALRGTVLVGEGADVCDYITAPDITLGPAFSPLIVHRTNALGERAPVNIVQYCRL
ncbi:hypothetical protein MSG28_001894 [Choristoneura fumiferana]|uniref:Uncharacterized protein n=1 Tax=Choristoneura fumiferana TaxID=7141 RepID=A0ACC0JTE0_CHOFU|nr:hypothetical protein MSG28_001894 [Choristoneura fumiferana]